MNATELLNEALRDAPEFDCIDAEGWQRCQDNNTGPYGGRVVKYVRDWGRLMQARIAAGETVAQCAKETSHIADDDGITGFMYGCAVGILSKCWKHGDELRRWHNLDTQIGNEGEKANESGGVLNPAVINIGQ